MGSKTARGPSLEALVEAMGLGPDTLHPGSWHITQEMAERCGWAGGCGCWNHSAFS